MQVIPHGIQGAFVIEPLAMPCFDLIVSARAAMGIGVKPWQKYLCCLFVLLDAGGTGEDCRSSPGQRFDAMPPPVILGGG